MAELNKFSPDSEALMQCEEETLKYFEQKVDCGYSPLYSSGSPAAGEAITMVDKSVRVTLKNSKGTKSKTIVLRMSEIISVQALCKLGQA